MDSYFYAIYGDIVVSKFLDFGNDFIKNIYKTQSTTFGLIFKNHGCISGVIYW